jgi:hypothetical protein
MNKQNILARPDGSKIEELLAKIQPVPSENFHQKIKLAAWRTENEEYQIKRLSNHRVRLAVAMTVLLILAGLLITPQGRAWAQEIFQFFKRINSTTVQLPDNQLKQMKDINNSYDLPLVPVFIPTVSSKLAVLPGCDTAQKSQSYGCQVALAESQLGFDLKELPAKPQDWKFEFLHFDAASKSATLGYSLDIRYQSYGSLYLLQRAGDFPEFYQGNPWALVPADKVEIVKIGTYNGEYMEGSFTLPVDSNNLVWNDSNHHKRLAWSDGTNWFLIELWPNLNLPDTIGRDQLIELAESLVNSPLEKETESLDPDYLYSISDAEKISGFDLKAPTLLPMEMSFSYARYYSYNQEVRLFYGLNNELVIYQWKGKSLDLDTLPKSYDPNLNYEIVKVHGGNAFYGSVEGPDAHLFLWWEEDGLYYQMYYYQYFGGTIDKQKMIAIAESIQDINDFRKKDSRPYEYVSIYEQALGLDAKEFPATPTRLSFANVWADPYARCITLIYKSVTEPGGLFIRQCHTDKYFNVSDIPSGSIQPVQIGNNQGMYTVGDFVTSDNGKLNWNPALPFKQLYWQEDGLWIQMTLSGESAFLHDKDGLISYAESLH